jgi:hypothetical protein
MIATTTTQDLNVLLQESDWVAEQLERLQHEVLHVSPVKQTQPAQPQPRG